MLPLRSAIGDQRSSSATFSLHLVHVAAEKIRDIVGRRPFGEALPPHGIA
jgi:hypothetical protein